MDHIAYAQSLRDRTDRHYNCCQAVAATFAGDAGAEEETVLKFGEHFGSGMRRGGVCGAVTGGLMALGLLGEDGQEAAREFQREFAERAGELECAALLRGAVQNGEARKDHCDRMVALAVELVERRMEFSRREE